MNDDRKLSRARALLDQAASELDSNTTARLRAMRLRAVDAAAARHARRAIWWTPLPAAAIAATVVAVTIAVLWTRMPEPAVTTATEDAEWILAAKDNPELFSEQLEFYDWLADDNDAS